MSTFLQLYGDDLDRELGTADRSVLFNLARRKDAINAAQQEWVKRTECLVGLAAIPLVSGTPEYDLESVGDFAWTEKDGVSIKQITSASLALSPVGYWPLDDLAGATVADASGHLHPGTLVGTYTPGVVGPDVDLQGTTFDGATSYATMGNVASASFTGAFSVEFWFNMTGAPALAAMVSKLSAAIDRGWCVFQYSASGQIQFFAKSNAGVTLWDVQTPAVYNDGAWHHGLCSWTGTTAANGVKIAIDGVTVKQAAAAAGTLGTTTDPLAFGSFGALTSGFFPGSLYGVALYNADVSASAATLFAGPGTTRYLEGDDLTVTSVSRLDVETPGWRASTPGTPVQTYTRRLRGALRLGLTPPPAITLERWQALVPYVAVPTAMSADADEPFTMNGNALRSLRPWHRALPHFAAYDLEKFRKDQARGGAQLQLFELEVAKFIGMEKPKGGQRVRLATDYRQRARGRLAPTRFNPRA